MDLYKYSFRKKIKVTLKSGTVFFGSSDDLFRKEDFETEYDELAIDVGDIIVNKGDVRYGAQTFIPENEIESIEIL